jgi:glycerophosphoryl diester phosphodiesterase
VSTRFLDARTPIAMAHRGYSPDGGENSLAAFARAVELGYRYLETDVRVTADGVALAFHDAALDRVTDARGRLSRLTWADVRAARIGGVEPIPQLADVLATWPDVRVNIDVKSDAGVVPTVEAIRRTGSARRVCVGAFSDRRIGRLRAVLGPAVCTAIGPREAVRLRLRSRAGLGVRRVEDRCAQLPARLAGRPVVDAKLISTARRAGLAVHAWTVNERDEMIRLLELGVDGIITDRCDILKDVLTERGQWPTS